MDYDNDFGYFGFVHVIGMIVYGFFALIALAVVVGLIILLVRFLLVGTKAAHLYIARNTPAGTASPVTESPTTGSTEPASRPTPPTTTPTGTTSTPAASTSARATPAVSATPPNLSSAPKGDAAPQVTPTVPVKKPRTPKAPPAI